MTPALRNKACGSLGHDPKRSQTFQIRSCGKDKQIESAQGVPPGWQSSLKGFSPGVQPTGNLHLGNYLGAIAKFVDLQKTHACIYCVVDLHAITMPHKPEELKASIREVTAAFIACGIDPEQHIVFNQSQVGQHAELAWVFNCVGRVVLAQSHDAIQG